MLLAVLSSVLLAAQSPATGAPANTPPPIEIRAARSNASIDVDGVLDEAAWQAAPVVSEFHQRDPVEGGVPSQRTEVRGLFDDEALYVGAHLYDRSPDSILARLSRRDVSVPADNFTVYLDPYHDQRSGYYFQINAAGTLFDGTLMNDDWDDNSWDGVWQGRAMKRRHAVTVMLDFKGNVTSR